MLQGLKIKLFLEFLRSGSGSSKREPVLRLAMSILIGSVIIFSHGRPDCCQVLQYKCTQTRLPFKFTGATVQLCQAKCMHHKSVYSSITVPSIVCAPNLAAGMGVVSPLGNAIPYLNYSFPCKNIPNYLSG